MIKKFDDSRINLVELIICSFLNNGKYKKNTVTFIAQQNVIVKIHHWKAEKISYPEVYLVTL